MILLLAAAAVSSSLVALGTASSHTHRLYAAGTALLDVVALAALAHVILLGYQLGFGQDPWSDPDHPTLHFRRRGLKAAVIGEDGRASTSKTQVMLLIGAVVWALIDLLLMARVYPGGNPFTSSVTSNWHPEYLILLGLPVAAAGIAKLLVTSTNVGQGPMTIGQAYGLGISRVYIRSPVPHDAWGFGRGVAELITSDDDTVAGADLQYVVVTLIIVAYIVVQILAQPRSGLPPVPVALLAIMGVSAFVYTARKVMDTKGSVIASERDYQPRKQHYQQQEPQPATASVAPETQPVAPSATTATQAAPQGQRDPVYELAVITLIGSLWIGFVTCVGVLVASAALARGAIQIGGMIFGAGSAVVTAVWLLVTIRARMGRRAERAGHARIPP